MKNRRALASSLFSITLLLMVFSPIHQVMSSPQTPATAILIRINTTIDYRMANLVEDAARDIESGKANYLIVEVDDADGYMAPTIQIVNRLASLNGKVVTYVGPEGGRASGFAAFIAMAGNLFVMNSGTWVGGAAIASEASTSLTYMTSIVNTMGNLAIANNRNPQAAERMVTDNIEYSASDAYAKGICNLLVVSYENLLTILKIDAQNVTEENANQNLNMSQNSYYDMLKLFANPTAINGMAILASILIVLNFVLLLFRPKKDTDEAYQRLLDLMKMEMHALELSYQTKGGSVMNETMLQTPVNIAYQPVPSVNRLPTPLQDGRLEKLLEVKKK